MYSYQKKEKAWEKINELALNISPEIWDPLLELIYEIRDLQEQDAYDEGYSHGRTSILE